MKLLHNLTGDEHWPFIPMVDVAGSPDAQPIPEDATQEEAEKIIQSWNKIAVLKVDPDVAVYFGFIVGSHSQFLNVALECKDGQFGVRVGDSDVTFLVIPADLSTRTSLELVEIADIGDPKYEDLPLY